MSDNKVDKLADSIWILAGLLLIGILILSCLVGCVPNAVRKSHAQMDHENSKAREIARKAIEAVIASGGDPSPFERMDFRLERSELLLDELRRGWPAKDFIPTDDSFDKVHGEIAKLRAEMEALRGLFNSLKGITKAVGGLAGLNPLLGGGGIAALLGMIAAIVKALGAKKELKAECADRQKSETLFGVMAEQIREEQDRKPGSMDGLLTNIRAATVAKNMYNDHEAALEQAGHKTTRKDRKDRKEASGEG